MAVPLPHLFIYLSLPLTSLSPQLIAPPISYLNLVVGFFFSLPVLPMVLLLFESQGCILSPLVFFVYFLLLYSPRSFKLYVIVNKIV